jgi:predicted nuclease of predicted toxin-antitoxin system
MSILLDENLNWRLERFLPGHACSSVPRIGWAGSKNGVLLQQAAAAGFDVLISMDGALATQQNRANLPLAVVVLRASSNRLEDTSPLMPQVLAVLPTLPAGQIVVVGG